MLWMIYKKERTITEISKVTGMSIASVQQHFIRLRRNNLVSGVKSGRTYTFTLHPENEKLLRAIFRQFDNSVKENIE